jgi:thiol-disulfide isomerase/thioredoxin
LVVVLLLTSRFAVAEPTLDEAIAHAAQTNKPLVVELYAEWCGPCHVFEEKVLTRADVKSELATVDFIRYDIDRPIGGDIADRFNAAGVPAFLVFDRAGKERFRHLGGFAPREFLDFLARANGARTLTSQLEAAVIVHPQDMAARMALARHYLELGRVDEARVQLALIVDGNDRQLAAHAFATLTALDLAKQRVSAVLDAALELVTRFPDSRDASMQLAILAVAKDLDREQIHQFLETHLAAVPDDAFDTAVRVAIFTGHIPVARAALTQRPSLKNARLIDAELSLIESNDVAKIKATCREPGNDYLCFLLEDAVERGRRVTDLTAQMAAEAKYTLDALEHTHIEEPSFHGLEVLAAQPLAFRNAVAGALRSARTRCAGQADTNEWVFVYLKFAGGRFARLDVRGSGDLQTCIRSELTASLIGPVPVELDASIIEPLRFEMPRREQPRPGPAIGEGGLFAGLAADINNEVYTFSAHGQLAFLKSRSPRWARLIVAGDVEMGASSYGFAYVARAYVGTAFALRPWLSISDSAGLGISDLGDELLPRAFTLPVEQRIRVTTRDRQIHLWLRESFVLGDNVRRRDGLGGIDEWAFGFGISTENGKRQPLYTQFSFEKRVESAALVFSLGAAFGSF